MTHQIKCFVATTLNPCYFVFMQYSQFLNNFFKIPKTSLSLNNVNVLLLKVCK